MSSKVAEGSVSPDRVVILGTAVDRLSMAECIERIGSLIRSGGSHLVATADACGLVQAETDADLRDIYQAASLVTPDSVGVLWAARRAGRPIDARVSGVDLVDRICFESANRGWRIFFLGAAPGVAEQAAEKLRLKHPGCNIVGTRHGFFPPESDEIVAAEIGALNPDVLFVAMGIPRQEKFLQATAHLHQAKIGMGVGGSFDVFSGNVKRAPKGFQRLHLEWLWRLIQNPKKISKVSLLPQFVVRVLRTS